MRLKFRKQASQIKQEVACSNIDFGRGLTKTLKLATILFLLLGSWGTTEIARAETARIDDITIDRQPDETYESLIGRAEAAARSAVQQGFDQGNRVTDVSVVVLGQNQGTISPVLVVELSRFQWNNSDVQSGITYFSSARSLLGLEEQQLANTNANPNQPPASENPSTPPGGQNDANSPTNSRQVIESIPAQPVTPPTPPGISPPPLPGGPALTPNPQQPATPDSSSDNNSNSNGVNNTPQTTTPSGDSSQQNITPPPVNNSTPQITGPTPGNEQSLPSLPQGTPSNNTNSNTPLSQP